MDFDSLLNNPKQYIDNIVQTTDALPDLGLKDQIDGFLNEDPSLIEKIPVVATLGHLQMTLPGSLVRIRCFLIQYITDEYLPLRVFNNDKYYSPIYNQNIPEGTDVPDIRTFSKRVNFLASSIPSLTSWMINELSADVESSDLHLNLKDLMSKPINNIFEEPFQINAKFLHELSLKPLVMLELIGFIDEPAPLKMGDDMEFENYNYLSSLPSFIALTAAPIPSLYSPPIPSPMPSLSEVRGHLMSFLTEIFEPPQAELLLLWMIGSVKSRKDDVVLGLFSLNLFGVDPPLAKLLIQLFNFLFTSVVDISLNVDSFNTITYRPLVENSTLQPSPLVVANETRLIINETELDAGHLNKTGYENWRIIRKIISEQKLDFCYEGIETEVMVSFPTLILSGGRTILSDDLIKVQAFSPIGTIKQPDLNVDPNLILLIRKYIDNIRFNDFDFSDEDSKILEKCIFKVKTENRELTDENLHFLMILYKLGCISLGVEGFSEDVWDHSVQILASLLPYEKK